MASNFWHTARLFLILAAGLLWTGWVNAAALPADEEMPVLAVRISPAATLPTTADKVIEQMAAAAGVIFAGQVVAVRRPAGYAGSSQDAAEGVVEIDFRVDAAVRGCRQGSLYRLREWAGLWTASGERYRIGQRLLMFLRSPDAEGLNSPVHGVEGAVPLRGGGTAPGPDDGTSATAEWMVDLRWVQAQALRTGRRGEPLPGPAPERGPGQSPFEAVGRDRRIATEAITEKIKAASFDSREPSAAATISGLSVPWMSAPTPLAGAPKVEPLSQVLGLIDRQVINPQLIHGDVMSRGTERNDATR